MDEQVHVWLCVVLERITIRRSKKLDQNSPVAETMVTLLQQEREMQKRTNIFPGPVTLCREEFQIDLAHILQITEI